MVKIFMVAFQYLWNFVVITYLTSFHFTTEKDLRRSHFIGVPNKSKSYSTAFATKSNTSPASSKFFSAKSTFDYSRFFPHPFKLAFSTATMLLGAGWDSFKRFSTYFTIFSYSGKNLTPFPSYTSSCFISKIKFSHSLIISQSRRDCLCL